MSNVTTEPSTFRKAERADQMEAKRSLLQKVTSEEAEKAICLGFYEMHDSHTEQGFDWDITVKIAAFRTQTGYIFDSKVDHIQDACGISRSNTQSIFRVKDLSDPSPDSLNHVEKLALDSCILELEQLG